MATQTANPGVTTTPVQVSRRPACDRIADWFNAHRQIAYWVGAVIAVGVGLFLWTLATNRKSESIARQRARGEGDQVLGALLVGLAARLGDDGREPRLAGLGDPPVGGDQRGELQLVLERRGRLGLPAAVRIHDQQVHGVRPDVEDTESQALS